LTLSPDGRYAVFGVLAREVPPEWAGYRERLLQGFVRERRATGVASRIIRYMLFDTHQKTLVPLVNAPAGWSGSNIMWAEDGVSVIVTNTYLPLNDVDAEERASRELKMYTVKINLKTRQFEKVSNDPIRPVQPVDVTLDERFDQAPAIYATNGRTGKRTLLLNLNPQFAELALARVEEVSWQASDGKEVSGGLYWPVDYQPGHRYPLVIQSHGFNPNKFAIDGPWSSAFAAQPLASAGFFVLQMGFWKDGSLGKVVNTPQEGPLERSAFEGAIDYLDRRGLADLGRIGIVGFSRTVFTVADTLTKSKYHFAAAILCDGMDGGYFQYISYPSFWNEFEGLMGGPPFGRSLHEWLERSPGFNLDKVSTPVRLVALGPASLLEGWEWFSGLSRLGKPVEFIYLPDAAHLIVKPWERAVAQQGLVDWFQFWLRGEEDADPSKQQQYARWRDLRESSGRAPLK
jgi:hypothetical protein